MKDKISMIELFSGVGAQERALRQLGLPYEVKHTCDCDANAVLSYAAMRYDLEKEMETFEFPSQNKMIEELQAKNLGYDFQKGKHSITKRTPLGKLKQYYIADKLSRNLGDISKVDKLPYADIVTYSFPCTDLSVAGKGEGMVNKCDNCGHSWPIDFSNAEEALVCPNCGASVSSSTRSGLLGQVQRLLGIAKENDILPKYLLLENVKNLVGKKFKPQFDAWLKWLDSIGYNTYYKVLNAKNYGIPQNRERVFAISIRKDMDTNGFTFPESIPLTTRLKDVLEKSVDEKYYLPDERIEKILNSSFIQEKKRIQTTDVCDTLLARDWKDPKCVQIEEDVNPIRIGGLYDDEDGKHQAGAIWDKEGISPTLDTMSGGNRQPFIVEAQESQIDIKERFFRQVAETVLENQCEPGDTIDAFNKKVNHSGVSPTITTRPEGFKTAILPVVEEPFIVASRGRNPENPSDRTTGAPTEQRLEPNFSGCTNTLTSVQKDNYVCEPKIVQNPHGFNKGSVQEECPAITSSYFQENNYVAEPIAYDEQNNYMRKDGTVGTITTDGSSPKHNNRIIEPIIYDDYNSRISNDQEAINTLTCNCGASAERNGVKIIEPVIIDDIYNSREPRIYPDAAPTLRSERTGLKVADGNVQKQDINPKLVGGIGEKNFGKQYRQGNRVYDSDEIAMALNAQPIGNTGGYSYLYAVEEEQPKIKWRIRKLTPLECWRLMNFTDEDCNRAAKYVSASAQYKQAGNSIVVGCLIAIFSSLFVEDGYKADVWTKYILNYND